MASHDVSWCDIIWVNEIGHGECDYKIVIFTNTYMYIYIWWAPLLALQYILDGECMTSLHSIHSPVSLARLIKACGCSRVLLSHRIFTINQVERRLTPEIIGKWGIKHRKFLKLRYPYGILDNRDPCPIQVTHRRKDISSSTILHVPSQIF